MASGLEALEERRRQHSTRSANIPPSLHQPAAAAAKSISVSTARDETPEPRSSALAHKAETVSEATPAKPAEAVVGDLSKTTMWLSAENDSFLEDVRTVGRKTRPKVDASRSAVTRFALARLAQEMTPVQVAEELRGHVANSNAVGRKRL